jgi:hypothetical protein
VHTPTIVSSKQVVVVVIVPFHPLVTEPIRLSHEGSEANGAEQAQDRDLESASSVLGGRAVAALRVVTTLGVVATLGVIPTLRVVGNVRSVDKLTTEDGAVDATRADTQGDVGGTLEVVLEGEVIGRVDHTSHADLAVRADRAVVDEGVGAVQGDAELLAVLGVGTGEETALSERLAGSLVVTSNNGVLASAIPDKLDDITLSSVLEGGGLELERLGKLDLVDGSLRQGNEAGDGDDALERRHCICVRV